MAKISTAWEDGLKAASTARGMRFVSGTPYLIDDVYITTLTAWFLGATKDGSGRRVEWRVEIKPLRVDALLWEAFMPDTTMGPRMQLNRRINGAFRVQPLVIAEGVTPVEPCAEPDLAAALDAFEAARNDFIAAHPDQASFARALEDRPEASRSRGVVLLITALLAADRPADAARVADGAIARGETGSMSSVVDVLKYLAAYAKGPEAYAAFEASLVPTHTMQILRETTPSSAHELRREHYVGRFGHHLSSMDGSDPWAVILEETPPAGTDGYSGLRYLQAAGTAERMIVEFCRPDTEVPGAAVRSVVGRGGGGDRTVEFVLPRSTEVVGTHEVFDADEAAAMFETFYRTGDIGDGYTLRAVERFDPS